MATGDNSSPVRFLGGQTGSTNRELALDVFGGEVITAFMGNTLTLDKHTVKTVGGGAKSYRFPKTWKATSEYHSPGVELLGTDIDTTEVTVTVDDILVSHTAISDLDAMLSHFDVRGPFSEAMGFELADVFDKNVFRQLILAARTTASGPFPASPTKAIVGSSPTGKDWIDAIRQAQINLFDKRVPVSQKRYMAVSMSDFDKIKYATDANGNYLILNRDFGAVGGSIAGQRQSIQIEDVTVYPAYNLPTANETSDTTVYSKYRADYSTVKGVLWTPMSVATVKVMDVTFESMRDTRRLEDFLVAKLFVGHGVLRGECAMEFTAS